MEGLGWVGFARLDLLGASGSVEVLFYGLRMFGVSTVNSITRLGFEVK